jgi:hypothetical protein
LKIVNNNSKMSIKNKEMRDISGFMSHKAVENISSFAFSALSKIPRISLIINNGIVRWVSRGVLTFGVWIFNRSIQDFILRHISRIADTGINFLVNLFFKCYEFGSNGMTNDTHFIVIDGVYKEITVNSLLKTLINNEINTDGIHIYNKIPICIQGLDNIKRKNCANPHIKIWFPKLFTKIYDKLLIESVGGADELFIKNITEAKKEYQLEMINHDKIEYNDHKQDPIIVKCQRVCARQEYRCLKKVILKYLRLFNISGISATPLIIVIRGASGVGKSLFLDYISTNYNVTCCKYIISYIKNASETFEFLLTETKFRNNNIINIDELDKAFCAYNNAQNKEIINTKDDFLDQFFIFVNRLQPGTVLLLTLNDDSMFDVKKINPRHQPLVDRMIFKEVTDLKRDEIREFLKFYNEQIKKSKEYCSNIEKITATIREMNISARKLTQIMIYNLFDFKKVVDELNNMKI